MVFVVMHSVGAVPWLSVLVLCSVVLSFILFFYFFSADLYGLTMLEIIARHLLLSPYHPDLPAMCLIRPFL